MPTEIGGRKQAYIDNLMRNRASERALRGGHSRSRRAGACKAPGRVAVRSINDCVDFAPVPDGLCAFR